MMKTLSALFYLALFVCGVWCVKENNLAGAIFFGLAWGCENIAVSIDHWPKVQVWEYLKKKTGQPNAETPKTKNDKEGE